MLNYVKENKLGVITVVLSVTFMLLGLPAQIWQIWNTKSVAGISVFSFALLATQCSFWIAYGIQKKDKNVMIPNLFGAIFSTVIVVEYFIFH